VRHLLNYYYILLLSFYYHGWILFNNERAVSCVCVANVRVHNFKFRLGVRIRILSPVAMCNYRFDLPFPPFPPFPTGGLVGATVRVPRTQMPLVFGLHLGRVHALGGFSPKNVELKHGTAVFLPPLLVFLPPLLVFLPPLLVFLPLGVNSRRSSP
jgi:hypothetical protein